MTAAEAQAFADQPWGTRWVEVAKALKQIEGGAQPTAVQTPVVTIAAGGGVTEGAPAGFTLTAQPAPARDIAVTVAVAQSGAFAEASALGGRTVTIAAGSTAAVFPVATVDDAEDEPDGSVTATLGTGGGYTLGAGASATVAVADNDEPVPVISIAGGGAGVTEGAPAGFTLTAEPAPAADLAVTVTVTQSGAFAQTSALGARTVTIAAGSTAALFPVATVDDGVDEPDGSVTAALGTGSGYTLGASASATVAVADDDVSVPAIVTRRSIAREGSDDAVVFTVRLDRASAETVFVDYETSDGAGSWARTQPATAGADYTAVSGTLLFFPGQTVHTVSVPIIDDAIDEGTEYFLLRFSNPDGATLAAGDRETQGLIRNDDHLQTMWLSRFGRTVGSQVSDAVSERLDSGIAPGAHATLAGQGVDLSRMDEEQALADVMAGLARAFGAREEPAAEGDPFARHGLGGVWSEPASSSPRGMTGRELLLGSSFQVARKGKAGGPGPGAALAAWGRVAHGSFEGAQANDKGPISVDGEVVTGVLGADAEWDRLLAGVAVSLSEGEGTFAQTDVDKGSIESRLTTVSPYARVKLTGRLSAWGLVGFGAGDMTVVQEAREATETLPARTEMVTKTDIGLQMGALGARGAILTQDASGGMDLALRADAFFVRMDSDKAANSVETEADASRVRLVLEGGRRFAFPDSVALRPSVELGVRYDGGDAERGAGLELGGGVAYESQGLSIEMKARTLLAHADSEYGEWGASASVRYAPRADGRGLSMRAGSAWGTASGGAERLWSQAAGLTGGNADTEARLDAEVSYGVDARRGLLTPYAGVSLAESAETWRAGARWKLGPAWEVNLEASLTETGAEKPGGGVLLRGSRRW